MLKFFKFTLVGCSLIMLSACSGGSDSNKSTSEHTAPIGSLQVEDENTTTSDNMGILKATGIIQSFNSGSEEVKDGTLKDDGFYQVGTKAKYTKNETLGIVTDEITGLSWQDKNMTIKNLGGAEKYCEALEVSNFNDWRLPNIKELESIIDYSSVTPSISSKFISNNGIFVSSTVDSSNSDNVWAVDFESGTSVFVSVSIYQNVRCVRSDKPTENIPNLTRKNNIVIDNITKLQWEDTLNTEGNITNWETAITYCETLKLDTFLDWRLPNIIELKSLTERKRGIAIKGNKFLHTISGKYWSSSTDMKRNSNASNKYFAWIIDFSNAQDFNRGHKNNDEYNVRCVRSDTK